MSPLWAGSGSRRARTWACFVVLVAHLSLPHVHARQIEATGERAGTAAPALVVAQQLEATVPMAPGPHHDAASCAVCQALGHGALAASERVVHGLSCDSVAAFGTPGAVAARAERGRPAPRAPPFRA